MNVVRRHLGITNLTRSGVCKSAAARDARDRHPPLKVESFVSSCSEAKPRPIKMERARDSAVDAPI